LKDGAVVIRVPANPHKDIPNTNSQFDSAVEALGVAGLADQSAMISSYVGVVRGDAFAPAEIADKLKKTLGKEETAVVFRVEPTPVDNRVIGNAAFEALVQDMKLALALGKK